MDNYNRMMRTDMYSVSRMRLYTVAVSLVNTRSDDGVWLYGSYGRGGCFAGDGDVPLSIRLRGV